MEVYITRKEIGTKVRLSAHFELQKKHEEIWFEIPIEFQAWLTDSGDPFLVALIFSAMQTQQNITLKNTKVSKTLLRNLYEFQRAWVAWKPDRYHFIKINAATEGENHLKSNKALCAFTGGIDGGFVLHDNLLNPENKVGYPIHGLLYVHGFHIPLENIEASEKIYGALKKIGDELNIQAIKVCSNLRAFGDWHDTHAASIVACMMLFQNQFNAALLGSSHPYQYLRFPWGSNAVTDSLLSTDQLKIINYGGGYTRIEKLEKLLSWKSFQQQVNVCIRQFDKNCGHCEKCIRTMLGYIALNQPIPPTFPTNGFDWWRILLLLAYKDQEIKDYRSICKKAFSNPQVKKLLFVVLYFNTIMNKILNRALALIGETDLRGHERWRKLKSFFKYKGM